MSLIELNGVTLVSSGDEMDGLVKDGSLDYLDEVTDNPLIRSALAYATALMLTDSKSEAELAARLGRSHIARLRASVEHPDEPE